MTRHPVATARKALASPGPFSVVSVLTVFLFALAPVAAHSQQDPRMVEAVRVAREGLLDSARTLTAGLMAALPRTDALYPELLYTIALVASSEPDRRLYLRRVVVEYANSPWADNALLQLAQLDYAAGDAEATQRQIGQLLTDYPGTEVTAEAALWGARAAFDRNDPRLACAWLATGVAASDDDVELRNRLAFLNLRCQEPLRDTQPTQPTPPPPAEPRPSTGPSWHVQVAALSDPMAIDRALATLREMGYDATVVPGPGALQKVRAGRWSSRALAQSEVAKIQARFGGQPFVVSDP